MSLLLFWRGASAIFPPPIGTVIGDNFPSISIQIDFDNDPTSSTETWTDVDSYARSLTFKRGRQTELDRMEAGTLTLVLSNLDRRFEPEYTGSPYYPGVKPLRRIRVRAEWEGVVYPLFYGYIEGYEMSWPATGKDAVVKIEAVDGFKLLRIFQPRGSYENAIRDTSDGYPDVWYRLDELSGTICSDQMTGGLHGTYFGSPTFDAASLMTHDLNPAVWFDGVDDYIRIGDANALDVQGGSGVFMLECFVRAGSIAHGGTQTLFYKGTGSYHLFLRGHQVGSDSGAALVCERVGTGVYGSASLASALMQPDVGYYVNFVYPAQAMPGAATGPLFIVEQPGTLVGASAIGPTDRTAVATTSDLFIGSWGGTGRFFAGTIDEVALYTTQLNAGSISRFTIINHPFKAFAEYTHFERTPATRFAQMVDDTKLPWAVSVLNGGSAGTLVQHVAITEDGLSHALTVTQSDPHALIYFEKGGGTLTYQGSAYRTTNETSSRGTIGDGTGELPYAEVSPVEFSDERIYNEVRVSPPSAVSGGAFEETDETSRDAYGVRSLNIASLYTNTERLRALGTALLEKFKDPQLQIPQVSFLPAAEPSSLWPHALGADISYRYSFNRRPPGGGTISLDGFLEGYSHRIDMAGRNWVVDWDLSNAG